MSKHNGDRHSSDIQPEQITAYALGQVHGEELASVKAVVGEGDHARAGDAVREVQALAAAITAARHAEPLPKPSVELRAAIESRLDQLAAAEPPQPAVELPADRRPWNRQWTVALVAAGGICCLLVALLLPAAFTRLDKSPVAGNFDRIDGALPSAQRRSDMEVEKKLESGYVGELRDPFSNRNPAAISSAPSDTTQDESSSRMFRTFVGELEAQPSGAVPEASTTTGPQSIKNLSGSGAGYGGGVAAGGAGLGSPQAGSAAQNPGGAPYGEAGGNQGQPATNNYAGGYGASISNGNPQAGGYPGGAFQAGGSSGPAASAGGGAAHFYKGSRRSGGYPGSSPGYPGAAGYPGSASGSGKYGASIANNPVADDATIVDLRKKREEMEQQLAQRPASASEAREREIAAQGVRVSRSELTIRVGNTWEYDGYARDGGRQLASGDTASLGEQYETIVENSFLSPLSDPLSTFSIDVDTASYANVRRFLNEGRLPPPAAVRIEELVNYFNYSYPQPTGREPFSVNMEAAECPWNAGHLLLRVGLKGKEIHRTERPPSNLTFLLDVSGSMQDANKLPLLKTTLMMFVAELTENDRVSIVTYAGEAGLRLPPTRGNEKEKIMAAIDSLAAGGSTHGSAGIQLAYEQAGQYFLKDGTNRVLLATDGDLNVGVTSDDALVDLIKEKAVGGTFLTVLGFGTGNLKDGKLEKLADNGNGIYAYIDGVREGRKVLVEQMTGSLVTIAKDVKIQIEFNPAQIASYRLLGYENRVLAAADFNNDKKDAGEIGAGHTVTALYELVPVGKEVAAAAVVGEPLKYQAKREGSGFGVQGSGSTPDSRRPTPDSRLTEAAASGELLTLKLRYKEPDGVESRLVEFPLKERGGQFHAASKDLQFAAAVTSFGMILRGSEHRGTGNLPAVAEIAGGAIDADLSGYRAEFVDLVRKAQALGAK